MKFYSIILLCSVTFSDLNGNYFFYLFIFFDLVLINSVSICSSAVGAGKEINRRNPSPDNHPVLEGEGAPREEEEGEAEGGEEEEQEEGEGRGGGRGGRGGGRGAGGAGGPLGHHPLFLSILVLATQSGEGSVV